MSDKIRQDALNLRKLVRDAEAVSDEVLIACARLKHTLVEKDFDREFSLPFEAHGKEFPQQILYLIRIIRFIGVGED